MAARLAEIRPFLDERAWRLLLGAEARAIGYGGMKVVAAASKAKADTVSRGVHELAAGIVPDGRARAAGGGRVASEVVDPGLEPALERLVAPGTRGDPESALRWTTKSTSRLAEELGKSGREVSADTWMPAGAPERVNVHDFADKDLGKATPYGIYDLTANTGWVKVGTDADTGAFAVESIRRWWQTVGPQAYPRATRLLIAADSGGSNGSRLRLWKTELAALAAETDLHITVVHLPPGTSKWNRIEHRRFGHIAMNWRGRPLTSHEVIIETIGAVTTKTGLTVQAALDTDTSPKGIRISDRDMKTFEAEHLQRHPFHGDWNYTITTEPPNNTTRPNKPT